MKLRWRQNAYNNKSKDFKVPNFISKNLNLMVPKILKSQGY